MSDAEKRRTIENLLRLRGALDSHMPEKVSDQNLIIATWNLKEFGHFTERLPETYFYIAEIINRFDLVAIQEVKSTLTDLEIIMRLLGSNWAYLIADITEGTDGNSERFAYVYDKRRVRSSGLAGEVVLWNDITAGSTVTQLKRTPYITGFRAGWKSFAIINVHLQPGDSAAKTAVRREEVRLLMKAIRYKLERKRLWTDNLLIMGDTNLYKGDGDIVELVENEGFKEVDDLAGKPTNVAQSEIYDRIFFHETKYFQVPDAEVGVTGDTFKFFDHVYRSDDFVTYKELMLVHKDDPTTLTDDDAFEEYFTRYWRGNQMSDHYPVWLQLAIDSTDAFLEEKLSKF
jgi:endonuclease/exonuclease/phosphatase family metal-dependent hydrolase